MGKKWNILKNTVENLRVLLGIAWEADKWLVTAYYLSAMVGAVMPIGVGIAAKFLIDYLANNPDPGTAVMGTVVALVGVRYLMNGLDGMIYWVFNVSYIDFLFRSRMQNEINYRFDQKMVSMDAGYFEDPEAQNLISKSRDTKTWKLPDMLRGFSYIVRHATMAVLSWSVMSVYGWEWPTIVTLACIPRLISQTRQGQIEWSVYGAGAPKAKRLWYFEWIMCEPVVLKEVRVFQTGDYLLEKFRQTQRELYQMFRKPLDKYLPIWLGLNVWEVMVIFVITWWQIKRWQWGLITVGGLTLFMEMVWQLKTNIVQTAVEMGILFSNNLYANDFRKVLALPDLVKEATKPKQIDFSSPPKIEFRGVTFGYPGKKTKVLKGINLVINAGENVALVGVNGAGKTTIIKLLCRFYEVTSGEILVNGINIRDIARNDLYRLMGTLFQEFVHFHFTVKENIIMGDASGYSQERMELAAKQSGAAEFIEKFPNKYEQMLGREFDEGEEISGGQWQKLAIARAFYEQAPLLILDEPTSAIDAEAEYEIFSNLQKVYRDKTLLLVSHRFSTVRNANRIYVIEGGKVTESGTHQELMANKGKYAQMFSAQAKGYEG